MRAAGQCGRGRDADLLSAAAASAGAGDRVEGPPVGRHPLLDQLPVKLETCVGTVSAPVCNNGLIVRRDVEHQPLRPVLLERTHRRVCSRDILLLRVRTGLSCHTTGDKRGAGTAHLGVVDRGHAAPAQALRRAQGPGGRHAGHARHGGGARADGAARDTGPGARGRKCHEEHGPAPAPAPRSPCGRGRPAHSSKLMFPPKNKQKKIRGIIHERMKLRASDQLPSSAHGDGGPGGTGKPQGAGNAHAGVGAVRICWGWPVHVG